MKPCIDTDLIFKNVGGNKGIENETQKTTTIKKTVTKPTPPKPAAPKKSIPPTPTFKKAPVKKTTNTSPIGSSNQSSTGSNSSQSTRSNVPVPTACSTIQFMRPSSNGKRSRSTLSNSSKAPKPTFFGSTDLLVKAETRKSDGCLKRLQPLKDYPSKTAETSSTRIPEEYYYDGTTTYNDPIPFCHACGKKTSSKEEGGLNELECGHLLCTVCFGLLLQCVAKGFQTTHCPVSTECRIDTTQLKKLAPPPTPREIELEHHNMVLSMIDGVARIDCGRCRTVFIVVDGEEERDLCNLKIGSLGRKITYQCQNKKCQCFICFSCGLTFDTNVDFKIHACIEPKNALPFYANEEMIASPNYRLSSLTCFGCGLELLFSKPLRSLESSSTNNADSSSSSIKIICHHCLTKHATLPNKK